MKSLAILGSGGHGKVVADTACLLGWSEVVFFDDALQENGAVGPWRVLGGSGLLLARATVYDGLIVAIGENQTRLKRFQELRNAGANLVTLIHPKAVVSTYAKVGNGSVVLAAAVINIDAVLGESVIVNTGATVDHDCVLEGGVHIAPGVNLSGNVRVGAGSWIGVGASVKQGIRIGTNVTVGAGAVVVSDIADGLTVVGNPARPTC